MGIIALALFAPIISEFALLFQSRDYLLLGIIGIFLVGTLSGESFAKGVFAASLGVLIGMVGLDPMTAEGRFCCWCYSVKRRFGRTCAENL